MFLFPNWKFLRTTILSVAFLLFFSADLFAQGNSQSNPREWPVDQLFPWIIQTKEPLPSTAALPNTDFDIIRLDNPPLIHSTSVSDADSLQYMNTYTSDGDGNFATYAWSNSPTDTAVGIEWQTSGGSEGGIWMKFWAPKVEFYYINSTGDTVALESGLQIQTGERVEIIAKVIEGETGDGADRLCADWIDSVNTALGWTNFAPIGHANNPICDPYDIEPVRLPGAENLVFYKRGTGSDTVETLIFSESVSSFFIGADDAITNGDFKLVGLDGPDGTPRINEEASTDIDVIFPDAPMLDSAVIYDTDGDGKGDSIAAWYTMDFEQAPDSVFSTWSTGDTTKDLMKDGLDIQYSGNLLTIKDDKGILDETLADLEKQGNLRTVVTGESGRQVPDSTELINRIGPVLTGATIIEGLDDDTDPDTLIITVSKELEGDSLSGDILMLPNGAKVNVEGVKVGDGVWQFIVPPRTLNPQDSIKLNFDPSDAAITTDGNYPDPNNKPVEISDAGKYPPLNSEGNGFWDADEDGTMDSITFEFIQPLSDGQLSNLDIRFYWKDESGTVIELKPDPEDLVELDPSEPGYQKFGWVIPEDYELMPYLTSIEGRSYGYANIITGYTIGDDDFRDTTALEVNDKIAPVIDSVWLQPELKDDNKGDSLIIRFSEPIDTNAVKNYSFLNFKNGSNSEFEDGLVHKEAYQWDSTGTILTLRLSPEVELELRPDAADSIRAEFVDPDNGVGLVDLAGNEIGPNPPWIMINGDPRILVRSINLIGLDRSELSDLDDVEPISIEYLDDDITLKEIESQGALGHLLDFGAAPLEDEEGEVKLDSIYMKYEIFYYTSSGSYVTSLKGEIKCTDEAFDGNCFKNRKKVFVRWNMKAEDGRIVGFGAYVTRLYLFVKGAESDFERLDSRTIGVRAGTGEYNRDIQ